MRLACLYVADFPLAALCRAQPDLCGARLAVTDGHGPRATLLAVSADAARHGVTSGLTTAQAMAMDAGLQVHHVSPDTLRAAQAALCDAAASFSPRVEDAGAGLAYLDLEGLGTLFPSESQLATALAQRAAHLGLAAHVGIAGSQIAAYLAARNGGGVTVIPRGEEWQFLAPVPVELLDPAPELAATLQRWGLRSIGDLAALPASAVGTRLGAEGVRLVRRARGEDEHPMAPRVLPMHFEESIDLEYGIETLEPFLFVVRGLLDRLTARLTVRGFICGDLRLSLRLAARGRDERTVAVTAPSNDVKALLTLVRLHLEAHPPAAALEAVRVLAIPERLRAVQLDMFRPNGPAPAQLAVTLARLAAICGSERVGAPVVADSHRPEAYDLAPFLVAEEAPSLALPRGRKWPQGREPEWSASVLFPSPVSTSANGGGLGRGPVHGTEHPVIPLALRAVRPPQAVEVFCERDRPEFVRGNNLAGRVVYVAGPWRVQGDWWSDGRYTRDYYDAQLSDGCVYRLYCDLETQGWFVDGQYD